MQGDRREHRSYVFVLSLQATVQRALAPNEEYLLS